MAADHKVGMKASVPAYETVIGGALSATVFAMHFFISTRSSQVSKIMGK